MKRKLKAVSALILILCLLACTISCSRQENGGTADQIVSTGNQSSENGDTVGENTDASGVGNDDGTSSANGSSPRKIMPAPTDYTSDEEVATATDFANPDLARLAAVMRRAEAGESITVGVIGGSITQGSSASLADKNYASIMCKWWKETFPNSEITLINAGIGATDSYLGVHRVQQDLLDYNPDFVIVEFSVNDSSNTFYKMTYDNLVRRILLSESEPAVLLLYMTMEDGTNAFAMHGLVGFSYNLPQIHYGNIVLDKIKAGEFKWSDISPDNIHPNDKGHAICGELIWKYLNSVYAQLDNIGEPTAFTQSALTKERYMTASILDADDITPELSGGFSEGCASWSKFNQGWSTDNGGSFTFTVEASRIGILYYKCTSGTYGMAEVFVDGTSVLNLRGDFSGGWGNYGSAEQVLSENESGTHVVTIVVPEGEAFDIFGIMVSE